MRIAEVMSHSVETAAPDEPLQAVAQRMVDADIGFLPVVGATGLIGTVSDRDIIVRAVAAGHDASLPVAGIMETESISCLDDEESNAVAAGMRATDRRRLAVLDRRNRLVGVVSLADLDRASEEGAA
ncbi:CBS domain-containing protein [Ensifer soli]|uniref:CBS domain-containing protein n=1 Tax=Ciceribacter sp. sgz301302 TaxID=3342379 RepID=UPI0035BB6476